LKLSYNERRELESLPARIETLETEQTRLKAQSESADFYKESGDEIRTVLARLDSIESELEGLLARWMELEERNR
jgi:ATP-binding cassette subfamily F protein uup